MYQEIHSLVKTRSEVFKLDNPDLHRYDLRKAIRDIKRQYQNKLETQTNHMDTLCLWKTLHYITGYKANLNRIVGDNTSLPNELNAFYARSEQK
eukprot:g34183.t1